MNEQKQSENSTETKQATDKASTKAPTVDSDKVVKKIDEVADQQKEIMELQGEQEFQNKQISELVEVLQQREDREVKIAEEEAEQEKKEELEAKKQEKLTAKEQEEVLQDENEYKQAVLDALEGIQTSTEETQKQMVEVDKKFEHLQKTTVEGFFLETFAIVMAIGLSVFFNKAMKW